jgi:hypothetical protein
VGLVLKESLLIDTFEEAINPKILTGKQGANSH